MWSCWDPLYKYLYVVWNIFFFLIKVFPNYHEKKEVDVIVRGHDWFNNDHCVNAVCLCRSNIVVEMLLWPIKTLWTTKKPPQNICLILTPRKESAHSPRWLNGKTSAKISLLQIDEFECIHFQTRGRKTYYVWTLIS